MPRVGSAQKFGDFGRVAGQVLDRCALLGLAARAGCLEVLLDRPVAPGEQAEQLLGSLLAVVRFDRARDLLGVGDDTAEAA
jgi:hypothetical protein